MNPVPTSKEVLTLIAEWMRAQKEHDDKPASVPGRGGFNLWEGVPSGFFDDGGRAEDGDEMPEEKVIPDHEQKLIRAQVALDVYVAGKVEEVLQAIINQNNQQQQASRPEHELYPERG